MANDPYGFPDAAPASGSAESSALVSLWAGIAALILGVLGPCMCYATWIVALPVSVVAIWYGAQAKKAGREEKGFEAASTAGLVSGGVALFFALLWLGIAVLYAGVLVFAMAADNF